MNDQTVTVRFARPTKVGGKWRKPGDTLEADQDMAALLSAEGVLDDETSAPPPVAPDTEAFDQAVAVRAQELAETIVEAAVEEAVTELSAARDEANARAAEAEAKLGLLQERVLEAEAQIADGTEKPGPATAGDDIPPEKPKTPRTTGGRKKG